MKLAYTDSLTGLSNKLAYLELVESIENKISHKNIKEFSLVVLDLNDLKLTNDTYGHENGDKYIVEASSIICKFFSNSKAFRIGGDEFAIYLEGEDYLNRYNIVKEFNDLMINNIKDNITTVIALGIADFNASDDSSFQAVFERADTAMYQRKDELKKLKCATI